MQKRVSMKDIATKLGISTALVSYVLTGQENEKRVGAEMAEKIRKTAAELNYKPSQIARSLRKGSTMTIGLLLADIANPFFASMARIIEDEAAKHGYIVLIGSSDESAEKSGHLLDTFSDRQVDGFIIVPAEGSENQIKALHKKNTPLVLVDRFFPEIPTSHVVLNNYNASWDAVNYFVQKGFKRIGIIAYKTSLIHMRQRITGFVDCMKEHHLEENCHVKEIDYRNIRQSVENAILDLVVNNKKVDALLFATNSLTLPGLYCITKYGVKVPSDLAIIGFDGSESFDFFYSPLTYFKQPMAEIGKESVRILVDLLKGSSQTTQIALKPDFIIRDSCG